MTTQRISLIVVTAALLAAPARADEEAERQGRGHIGVYAGIVLPQLATTFATAPGIQLEGGYRVWRGLAPFLAVSYDQPTVDTDKTDPRLTGMTYHTSTTQKELQVTLGALYWFREPGTPLNVYGGLGLRAYFLETDTNGSSGGMPFDENQEKSTQLGGVAKIGAEYLLGPGALGLEVELGGSSLPHLITGGVQTTALGISIGYRLFF
jgi:hypothetical protein